MAADSIMPVQDWTRVEAGIFPDFHTVWIAEIRNARNEGLLPPGHYALAELAQARRRSLAIRHVSHHRLVALVEIVSPANKDRPQHVAELVEKITSAIDRGVHLLLVDPFPPGLHDPQGLHGAVWQRLSPLGELYDLPADEPLTLASYAAGSPVEIFVEHLAVGADLPDMLLFLRPDRYINVPLEAAYRIAYRGMPAFWRDVLEGSPPEP